MLHEASTSSLSVNELNHLILKLAGNITPGGLHVFDLDQPSGILSHRTATELLGYTAEDIKRMEDKVVETLLHPDDHARFFGYISALSNLKDDKVAEIEYRMRTQSGAWLWLHSRDCVFQRDANGAVRQMLGTTINITDNKHNNERLLFSEQLHHASFDCAPVGVAFVTTEGRFLKTNQAFCAITGYSAEELVSMHIVDITHQEDWAKETQPVKQFLTGEVKKYENEKRYVRKDGSIRWVHVTAQMVHDSDGKALHTVGIVQDVTERRKVEDSLQVIQEKNEFLANLIRDSSQPVSSGYPDGRIGLCNRAYEELVGYNATELSELNWQTVLTPPEWRALEWQKLDELLRTGQPVRYEKEYIRKDGKRVPVELFVHIVKTRNGQPRYYYAFINDITERKRNQAAQARHLARQAALLDVTHALMESDHDKVAMAHVVFEKVATCLGAEVCFNYRYDNKSHKLSLIEGIGLTQNKRDSIKSLDLGQSICGVVAQSKRPFLLNSSQIEKNPKAEFLRHAQITAYACHPLLDSDGKLMGTMAFGSKQHDEFRIEEAEFLQTICHFVSMAWQRRRAVERLLRAEAKADAANQAKSEFLANMSHEIRTPMNAVVGIANIFSMEKSLTDKQKEMTRVLKLSSASLMELINDVLDIAKIESTDTDLQNTPFTFETLMNEVVSIAGVKANEKGIHLKIVDSPEKYQRYLGDYQRIRQILMNLVSNAVKFTAQGGVTISLTSSASPDLDQHHIQLHVKDTGIGMPKDKLKSIFDKFTQADTSTTRLYGGTGLGLAISKNLATTMGGVITVISEPGQGSEFILHLTLEPAADDTTSNNHASNTYALSMLSVLPSSAKPWVLLVEDYAPNVLVASHILESMGYEIDLASNGEQALEIVHKHREKYCAILMDVQMPKIDGLEVTRIIRKEEKAHGISPIPIIAMTAYAMNQDRKRCLDAGMNGYISKPFQPKDLAALLAKYGIDSCQHMPHEATG